MTIKVGVIAPLSGPAATYGEDTVNVYQEAVSNFNQKHTDIQIKLVIEDSKCNGQDAVSATQKLIQIDGVQFILGGVCSGETIPAAKIANDQGVLILSPLSSAPEISDIGEYVFRLWNDTYIAKPMANYIDTNYDNIALIVENTDYAHALKNALLKDIQADVIFEDTFNSDEKDFTFLAKNIKNRPDIQSIVMLNQSEATGVAILKAFDAVGIHKKYVDHTIGAFMMGSPSFLDQAGDLATGLVQWNVGTLDGANQNTLNYIRNFEQKYAINSDKAFIVLSGEAFSLLSDAFLAGNTDPESVKNFFTRITKSNKRSGLYGDYYFDGSDAIGLKFIMQKVVDGELITLK